MADEAGFDEFFSAGFRRVVSQIYAMTGNLAEAEDAVAEAYARAWQRWDVVRGYLDPEAWIRTVAYRLAVSSWRKTVNRTCPTGVVGCGLLQLEYGATEAQLIVIGGDGPETFSRTG